MGLQFSRIWESMFGKKEMRILMVGLDAAGKVKYFLFHRFRDNYIFTFAFFYLLKYFRQQFSIN
jgi:hypothetical protein